MTPVPRKRTTAPLSVEAILRLYGEIRPCLSPLRLTVLEAGAILAPILFILLSTGCVSAVEAKKAPGTDLSQLKTFYVQKLPADDRGIERLIAGRLNLMGYGATSGASENPSSPVDAIVTYQDRWEWGWVYDGKNVYMQLSIQVREPQSRMVMATGYTFRMSLIPNAPGGMVEEVLTEIFKGGRP